MTFRFEPQKRPFDTAIAYSGSIFERTLPSKYALISQTLQMSTEPKVIRNVETILPDYDEVVND